MNIEFLLTAFIVVLAPGTGVIYTIGTGLTRGRKAAIFAAFGCTLGIVPHLAAAALGLAAILHTSALLFQIVKFAGVAFLLYLAWQTLNDDSAFTESVDPQEQKLAKIAIRGMLINILNPKLSIFFLAFLPQFLSGSIATATSEMIFLGLVFMAMTFAVFICYGVFAAVARNRVMESPKAMAWIRRVFAASFAAIGARLAFERA